MSFATQQSLGSAIQSYQWLVITDVENMKERLPMPALSCVK